MSAVGSGLIFSRCVRAFSIIRSNRGTLEHYQWQSNDISLNIAYMLLHEERSIDLADAYTTKPLFPLASKPVRADSVSFIAAGKLYLQTFIYNMNACVPCAQRNTENTRTRLPACLPSNTKVFLVVDSYSRLFSFTMHGKIHRRYPAPLYRSSL